MIPADRAEVLASELARLLANRRTHGEVFMDGRHNPLPTETKDAQRFIETVELILSMTPEEFEVVKTKLGY